MNDDRTAHAKHLDGDELVRYDRAGKWFLERPDGKRQRLGVHQAVRTSLGEGWTHLPGLPGGGDFDRLRARLGQNQ